MCLGESAVTRDEHRSIIAFIDGAARQHDEVTPEPMDVEADAIIRALFVRNPDAAYRITKLAMAQQEALSVLRAELAQAQADAARPWWTRIRRKYSRPRRARQKTLLSAFGRMASD